MLAHRGRKLVDGGLEFRKVDVVSLRWMVVDVVKDPKVLKEKHARCKAAQQAIDHPPIPLPDKNLPHIREIPAWSPTADVGEQLGFSIQLIACQVKDDPKLWNENRYLYVSKMQKEVVLVKFTRRY